MGHFCPPGSGCGSTDLIESGSETLKILFRFRQEAENASVAARLPLDEEDEEDRDSVLSAGSVETGGLRSSAGSVETGGSRPASRQNSASSMNGLRSVAASNGGVRRRSPNLSREPSGRYCAILCFGSRIRAVADPE